MAQRPAVLENLIFVFLGVLGVESGLKPSKARPYLRLFFQLPRGPPGNTLSRALQPLREIIHLLSADPEEGLPVEFVETLQPRLFSSEEFDAVSLLLSQKLIQRKGAAAGASPSFSLTGGTLTVDAN